MLQQAIFAALGLAIVIPIGAFLISERGAKRFKKTLVINISSFFAVLIVGTILIFTQSAFGAEAIDAASNATSMAFIAAGLATGMSCIGAGVAVASAASAAIGALSENEGILGKAIIFVGLAEGVALYGLIVSFMILGRV